MAGHSPHLLRTPMGRVLLAVQFLHALAQGMTVVVLPWVILDSGGSVTSAGLVLTASFLPFVLLGLPAGVAGDRGSRRWLLTGVLAAQSALALVMVLAVGAGGAPVAVLFTAAFLMGCGRVFVDAAMFGAIGAIVPREGMLSAQAAVASAFNLGYYGGPALGGLIIATAGTVPALAVITAALVAGSAVALRVRGAAAGQLRAASAPAGASAGAGLRLLFTEPTLRALAVIAFTWSLMSSGVITLALPHLRSGLGLGGAEVSVVLATGVLAMMLAPLLLHRIAGRVRDTRILVVALGTYLVPAAVFALAGGAVTAAVAYGSLMLANAVCAATIIGARARRTPAHLQALAGISGRMLVITGFTVGSALASTTAGALSTGSVYVLIGAGMSALALLAVPGLDRPARRAAMRPAARPALATPGA